MLSSRTLVVSTLLGTPAQSKAIQYMCPAIKKTMLTRVILLRNVSNIPPHVCEREGQDV